MNQIFISVKSSKNTNLTHKILGNENNFLPPKPEPFSLQYDKAMHTKTIPIGATIRYGSFVLSNEFEDLLGKFTAMEMEINGCKKRTPREDMP